MKANLALTGLLAASLAAPGALAQGITLDLSGGILGENLTCTLSGPVPGGEFVLLTFSDTTGPFPMSTFFPGDPSFLDQDATMFNYPSFVQGAGYANPLGVVSLVGLSPTLVGAKVFGQAWTTGGGLPFVDKKSNVVTVILGAHGASTPTHLPPLAGHAYAATATLLDGTLLVSGGSGGLGGAGSAVAELYDPKSASFLPTANNPLGRAAAPGIRLDDGRVLVVGGVDAAGLVTSSCELYDPATKTFAATGSMATPRILHTAVKLNDGRVLVCGGSTAISGADPVAQLLSMVSNATASAELFNPATGSWSPTTSLPSARTGHSAAILPDGRVLVAGGVQSGFLGIPTFLTSASRYNPGTNAWNSTASMGGVGRAISSVATLADGRVMLSGGVTANIVALTATAVADVSIYNNGTNSWQNGPTLALGRYGHTLVTIPGGDLVAAGGVFGSVSSTTTPVTTASVERYNPGSNLWSAASPMLEPRAAQSVGLTPDGKRLVFVGGSNDLGLIVPPTAELYVP